MSGVTSELQYPSDGRSGLNAFSLEKKAYLARLNRWILALRTQAENAVVEKLTAELTFVEDGSRTIAFYIIVAFQTQQAVSSYWIRKMKYQDINRNLMADVFLGSLIKNFSYMQCLPKAKAVDIPNQSALLMTPECVQYIGEYFNSFNQQQLLKEEKTDEDGLMHQMGNGYYVTRILAHSRRANDLWLYCGTTFDRKRAEKTGLLERRSLFANIGLLSWDKYSWKNQSQQQQKSGQYRKISVASIGKKRNLNGQGRKNV